MVVKSLNHTTVNLGKVTTGKWLATPDVISLLFTLMAIAWVKPAFSTFILTPTKDIQPEKSHD